MTNDLKQLLNVLRSYSVDPSNGEHKILDHKDKYEFNKQDHHWHLKTIYSYDRSGNVVSENGLFDNEDAPGVQLGSQTAVYEFNKAKKQGWNMENDPETGLTQLLPPSDDVIQDAWGDYENATKAALHKTSHPDSMSDSAKANFDQFDVKPEGRTGRRLYDYGHTAGFFSTFNEGKHLHPDALQELSFLAGETPYMAGFKRGALHGIHAQGGLGWSEEDLSQHLNMQDVKDLVADGSPLMSEYMKSIGGVLPTTAKDMADWLQKENILDDGHDTTWDKAQEAHATAIDKGVDEDVADDWKDNWVGHGPLESSEDLQNWMEYHGHWPYSGHELKEAHDFAEQNGVPDTVLEEWKNEKMGAAIAETPEELESWMYNNHDPMGYQGWRDALEEARDQGADPDVLQPLIDKGFNMNVSDGGMVDDSKYADRAFSLDKARKGVEAALQVGTPESGSSISEALSNDHGRDRFYQTAPIIFLSGEQVSWSNPQYSDTPRRVQATLDWAKNQATDEERERFYKDAARYMESTTDPNLSRFVLSDDSAGAMQWLDDGEYQYKRFTEVPSGDYNTRTNRENEMGIGRVNYAALGFEAALPPRASRNFSGDFCVPTSDLQSGRVADFRTQGYGDTRFSFTGTDGCSHAIDDTYYNPYYCGQGGSNALQANAVSFAGHQSDYRHIISPSVHPSSKGPNFLEMHPKELKAEQLSQVQMYSFGPNEYDFTPRFVVPQHHRDLIRKVLESSPASIVITPDHAAFWPNGLDAAGGQRREIANGADSEKEARDNLDEAQETLHTIVKNMGFSDGDAGRVKLYLPAWYSGK